MCCLNPLNSLTIIFALGLVKLSFICLWCVVLMLGVLRMRRKLWGDLVNFSQVSRGNPWLLEADFNCFIHASESLLEKVVLVMKKNLKTVWTMPSCLITLTWVAF